MKKSTGVFLAMAGAAVGAAAVIFALNKKKEKHDCEYDFDDDDMYDLNDSDLCDCPDCECNNKSEDNSEKSDEKNELQDIDEEVEIDSIEDEIEDVDQPQESDFN